MHATLFMHAHQAVENVTFLVRLTCLRLFVVVAAAVVVAAVVDGTASTAQVIRQGNG